jgi:N-acyl homoserine lactone hydrolase
LRWTGAPRTIAPIRPVTGTPMARLLPALARLLTALAALAALPVPATASEGAPERGPRLYVFDCGTLRMQDVSAFGIGNDETEVRELFVPCYLVDHPRGRLLWDAGLPDRLAGRGPVPIGPGETAELRESLVDQLARLDLTPADIDLMALSHMHFDHVGAAPRFPEATLLIQRAEYEAAFQRADEFRVFFPEYYAGVEGNERVLLDGDHDVFSDETVRIVSTPGHTPGHQALLLRLEDFGPLVLSGDLWHFRTSRRLQRVPAFNTDPEATLRSMARVEALLAREGATLWIEHDKALADTLRKAPAHYE